MRSAPCKPVGKAAAKSVFTKDGAPTIHASSCPSIRATAFDRRLSASAESNSAVVPVKLRINGDPASTASARLPAPIGGPPVGEVGEVGGDSRMPPC